MLELAGRGPAAAAAGVQQHVGRLDVPVHQIVLVGGVERRGHLADDRPDPVRGQRALPLQQRADVAALHVAHGDKEGAVGLAGLVDRDDVRVVNRGRRPRLADEPLPEPGVLGQRRGEQLQRDPPSQPLVGGPVDHGHPAQADLLLQQIPREPLTGRPSPRRHVSRSGRRPRRHRRISIPRPSGRSRTAWPSGTRTPIIRPAAGRPAARPGPPAPGPAAPGLPRPPVARAPGLRRGQVRPGRRPVRRRLRPRSALAAFAPQRRIRRRPARQHPGPVSPDPARLA